MGQGRTAAAAGYRTCSTTAADLAVRSHRVTVDGLLAHHHVNLHLPTLLDIDELGYLPTVCRRGRRRTVPGRLEHYLKTSSVLTTERRVASWGVVLGDTTGAAAMIDRLLHRCVVLNLDGESSRLRNHHAHNDTLRQAATPPPAPPQ